MTPEIPNFKSVHESLNPEVIEEIKELIENEYLSDYSVHLHDAFWQLEIEVYNKTIAACQKFLLETLESRKTDESGKSKERR